ncbi:unnamed protein product [Ambrosiozyma monospora]|uniref:Unnamed protein product n=1 Tax=Ambrosiozyma monospora TaxID=43982 RepID=A0A9W6Z4R4_AMBMO|nr:unnamed protein product [Ambrosiozyma monospora]
MIPAVQRLVSSVQQAFLPERSIHRTIQTTKVMSQFIKSGSPSHSDQQQQKTKIASLFMIDFKKAFDSCQTGLPEESTGSFFGSLPRRWSSYAVLKTLDMHNCWR